MKIRQPLQRHHIPSLFTLINLFLGFLAVISIVEGQYIRSAYLILAAGVFDVLDGKLARMIHSPSDFGSELDSLADLASFCLAPALLVWALYAQDLHPVLGALVAGSPLLFGALRLARFNTGQDAPPKAYFVGLPSPTSAIVIVSLVFYYEAQGHVGAAKVVLPAVMAVSFLMVSQIRYPKFPAVSFKVGPANTAQLLLVMTTLALFFFVDNRVFLPVAVFYIAAGMIRHLSRAGAEFRAERHGT